MMEWKEQRKERRTGIDAVYERDRTEQYEELEKLRREVEEQKDKRKENTKMKKK